MITWLALGASLDVTHVVDGFAVGAINRPRLTVAVAGGKSLNAARAAASLGADSAAIVVLAGYTGKRIEALLADSAVSTAVVWAPGETRICTSISAGTPALTELYERATPVGADAWARSVQLLGGVTSGWVAVSGGVPADVSLPELVAALAARRAAGVRVAIDTHGAALRAIVAGVRPDLVKVNRSEAAELLRVPATVPTEQLAVGIRLITAGTVVVTDGVEGAWLLHDGGSRPVAADSERGLFAVGSGDCFLGGFLAAIERGDRLEEAAVLASAVASANAARPGAAIFDLADVAAAATRIRARAFPSVGGGW